MKNYRKICRSLSVPAVEALVEVVLALGDAVERHGGFFPSWVRWSYPPEFAADAAPLLDAGLFRSVASDGAMISVELDLNVLASRRFQDALLSAVDRLPPRSSSLH